MEIKFNEKKVNKIASSKIKEKSLKYKVDTKLAINFLLGGLGCGFLSLIIRAGVARYIAASGALFAFISAVRHFSGENYNRIKQVCQSSSISFEELERDCEGSLNYSETPCIIGNRYIIISEKIISFEKVCWVFYGFKTVNNNGATARRGSITVCFDDGTVSECIMKENKAAVFLNEVHRKHPEVILGFSFELEKLFRTDISEFRKIADTMRPASVYEAKSDEINQL